MLLYHTEERQKVLDELATDETQGLSTDAVSQRLEKYGKNKLKEKKKKTNIQRFADQFKDAMILILIAAAVI